MILDNKFKKDDLHEFIAAKTQLKEKELLPELLKVKTVKNKLYYIHKSVFLTLVHNKIGDAHDFYRKHYLDNWSESLKDYNNPKEMLNDELFENDLEKKIKKEDPLLYAILGYELLYLTINDSKNIKMKALAQGWIDPKLEATRPLSIILGLRRKELAAEVRAIVPFWLTIGFFRKLFALFGGKRRNRKAKKKGKKSVGGKSHVSAMPRSTAVTDMTVGSRSVVDKSRQLKYKRSVDLLRQHYNYSTATIFERLDNLSAEWNPLLDGQARINLVKDVNNMVRDYMRKILRETAFAVPDTERIENIAELLAGNKAFTMIKKRSLFREYIILCIIKTLTETKP